MCSLVTEAWVQVGETALWSKWDASSTWHHLRHHCWWLITSLMMLKILAGPQLFTLDLVWINCWLIHKVGELRLAAWKHQQNCQHPVFRYCTGAEKGYLQAKHFATKVRKLRQSSKRKENDNIHWILFRTPQEFWQLCWEWYLTSLVLNKKIPSEGRWYPPKCVTPGVTARGHSIIISISINMPTFRKRSHLVTPPLHRQRLTYWFHHNIDFISQSHLI